MFSGKIFSLARAVVNGGSEEKAAVLHAGVSDANTITMVADGSFYLLAAYSMLLGGIPIGMDAGSAPLVLRPAPLPEGVVVGSGR